MASSVSDIVEKITEYIQIKTEQVKLSIIGYASRILSNLLAVLLIVVIGFFFLFFLSFSFGAFLNQVLESNFLGHLIVAGSYLLLIIIIIILIKSGKIQSWLEHIILKMAEQDEQED